MSDESFADMFAQSEKEEPKKRSLPKVGDHVSGVVTSVGQKRLTLDLGNGVDGMMELVALGDMPILPHAGNKIDGFVIAIENRVAMIGRAVAKGQSAMAAVEQAAAARLPIEGLISGINKGGYVVEIAGVRCFCPLGQMDVRRIEDPNTMLGKKLDFLVSELKGRDVVLSRRALLETAAKAARTETLAKLSVGAVLEGTVSSVREFGAFIDLGGIDGLVPVSELGFGRTKAADAVKVGQHVRVSVLKIEGSPPERISLSMRALMDNPLEAALSELQPGLVLRGKVTSLQAFGAFVELTPGVEGLIHISKFGKRVATVAEMVAVGDIVTVRIDKVEGQKIGLAWIDPTRAFAQETKTHSGLVVLGRDEESADSPAQARKIFAAPVAGHVVQVTVDKIEHFGLFVTFDGGRGLVPASELDAKGSELRKAYPLGSTFRAVILEVRNDGKIRLSKTATEAAEERAEADAFLKTQSGSQGFGAFAAKLSSALSAKK